MATTKKKAETPKKAEAPKKEEVPKKDPKLTKAEKRIAELEAELADAHSAAGPFGAPPAEDRVFGPDAIPLEQR